MTDFVGRDGFLAVFSNATDAVIIDTNLNLVVGLGKSDVVLPSRDWEPTNETFSDSTLELATGALTTLDIKVITASGRMYTIPAGVVSEAKKSLEWHKEHHRGGTPVGLNTARTLARGGQIGIEKVRHIAKYFPRHEVDKKGKGWQPGQDGFPSNGRIAWALWGGDSARRWASAIVERENKKATTASGYAINGYDADSEIYKTPESYESNVDAFKDAFELGEGVAPEFMARVRLDGSGMDRLYKLDTDGQVYVWDDMGWDSLGHVDGDVWTYDKALDDPYDSCEKDHTIIDPESAMIMSALLQESPFGIVSINDIDPEEAELFEDAAPQEDWDFLKSITAAMPPAAAQQKGPSGAVAKDSVYSPKERSINAKSQTRDAGGMFVAKGSRVVVGNDGENGRGQVTGLNPATGATTVELDNGKTIEVPAKLTQKEDKFAQAAAPVAPANVPTAEELSEPLDVSGVLGEPRSPINQAAAKLPGTLPPMNQGALQDVLQNWGGFVESQRAAFKPITDQQAKDYAKRTGQTAIPNPAQLDPNTTKNAGAASKQVAVPGENGQISVQDAPMMAGRAGFKKDTQDDSGKDDGKDKLREQLQGIKDRTTYHNKIFTPSEKTAAPAKPAPSSSKGTPGNGSGRGGAKPAPSKGQPGAWSTSPTKPTPSKGQPGAWDTGKNGTGRPNVKSEPGAWDTGKNGTGRTGPAAPTSPYDSKGRYVVQKGDSLWSIAEKTTPKGKSVGEHWRDIMKSNPNMKSGDPNKIFSGERVWIPGQGKPKPVTQVPYKPGAKVPAQKPNFLDKVNEIRKSNKPAPSKGQPGAWDTGKNGTGRTGPVQPKGNPGAWSTSPTKPTKPVAPSGKGSGSAGTKPGTGSKGQPGAWSTSPTKPTPSKGQPGAWDTGKNGTGRTGKAAPTGMYDSKGRYVVQKGDSLWSIADKTKPEGTSTAKHWTDVMKSNKGNIKSGNPSLIYSGERLNIPNKPKPGPDKSKAGAWDTGKNGTGRTGPVQPKGNPGAWSTSPTRPAAPTKPTRPVPKPAAPKPTGKPGAWDTGKNGTGKPSATTSEPKYKPVGDNKIAAHARAGLDAIIKPKGSAGARKRKSN